MTTKPPSPETIDKELTGLLVRVNGMSDRLKNQAARITQLERLVDGLAGNLADLDESVNGHAPIQFNQHTNSGSHTGPTAPLIQGSDPPHEPAYIISAETAPRASTGASIDHSGCGPCHLELILLDAHDICPACTYRASDHPSWAHHSDNVIRREKSRGLPTGPRVSSLMQSDQPTGEPNEIDR